MMLSDDVEDDDDAYDNDDGNDARDIDWWRHLVPSGSQLRLQITNFVGVFLKCHYEIIR